MTARATARIDADSGATSSPSATAPDGARPDAGRSPGEMARTAWQAGLLVLPTVVLVAGAWHRRWTTDDGFINFRVVRMILEGHGPVFNVGERVEATTSTVWIWLLVAGDLVLPLDLEWVAVVLAIACAAGGLLAATWGAARLHRHLGAAGLLVPAGAVAVGLLSPVWDFSTSGLEGGVTFGWLGLSSLVLARWATMERPMGAVSAAVIGLGWLVRPDLLLVSAVLVPTVLYVQWRTLTAGGRLRFLAAAAGLPAAYQVLRMGFYASLVPNTGLAKAGTGSRWHIGVDYLRDFAQPYLLVVPVAILLLAVLLPAAFRAWADADRRAVVALVALPVGGVLHGLYVVRVGGDYMHARLLLPSFVAFCMPLAVAPVPTLAALRDALRARGRSARLAPLAVTAGLAVLLIWGVVSTSRLRSTAVVPTLFSADGREQSDGLYGVNAVTADQQWGAGQPTPGGTDVLVRDGSLRVEDPPDDLPVPAYAGGGIGLPGYVFGTDVHVIDTLGLADPVTSRFELDERGLTGHEKQLPLPWLSARVSQGGLPDDAAGDNGFLVPLYESPPGRLPGDAAAARQALGCGELADLREAISDELTPGRFLSNLVAAPQLTRVSVPPDPNEAVDRFCG